MEHQHTWELPPVGKRRDRLVGDVYQDLVFCDCGATAWRYNWVLFLYIHYHQCSEAILHWFLLILILRLVRIRLLT